MTYLQSIWWKLKARYQWADPTVSRFSIWWKKEWIRLDYQPLFGKWAHAAVAEWISQEIKLLLVLCQPTGTWTFHSCEVLNKYKQSIVHIIGVPLIYVYIAACLIFKSTVEPGTASGNVCACVKLAGKHLLTENRNGRKLSWSTFKGDFFAYPVDSRHVL